MLFFNHYMNKPCRKNQKNWFRYGLWPCVFNTPKIKDFGDPECTPKIGDFGDPEYTPKIGDFGDPG